VLNALRRRVSARRRGRAADVSDVLDVARQSFLRLQQAWDAADLQTLAACTTAPLLADLSEQLAMRGPGRNHTQVRRLQAKLLALDEVPEAFVASVEFSGLIRENDDRAEAPFRELWLLASMKSSATGWQLAGVQSLS
jgi:predicted lipid-binding transport protein (Tim44 family)